MEEDRLFMRDIIETEVFLMKSYGLQIGQILMLPSIDAQMLVMRESAEIERREEERQAKETAGKPFNLAGISPHANAFKELMFNQQ